MQSPSSADELSSIIKEEALSLGFSACGIARAEELAEEKQHLSEWLKEGMHASMHWMTRNTELRTNPELLLPGAKSILVVLLNYYPKKLQGVTGIPVISKYAYGRDYHKVIRKKLKKLVKWMDGMMPGFRYRIFVDSAPVMERAWAVRAGLGWQGKNSLLIRPGLGSFVFIGGVISDAEWKPDVPFSGDLCGACTRCIDACPTKAIVQPGVVDARRCISYLTIEHKGEIPSEFRPHMKSRIFGCDICQDVCPHNTLAQAHNIPEFEPAADLYMLNREEFLNLHPGQYQQIFRGTPVDRIGFDGLKRNIAFASGE